MIDAILWDYDGTMVDTIPKNIAITRAIIEEVAPRLSGACMPEGLRNPSRYQLDNHAAENWRDLYMNFYGLTADETDAAGRLWHSHQITNETPVIAFDGIADTINAMAHVPQGICSQNSAKNIHQVLSEYGIAQHFGEIVGYEDIPYSRQKPAPDSGLLCLAKLLSETDNVTLLYVGDHQADTIFARNIEKQLGAAATVLAVAVTYSGADPLSWPHKPDWIIDDPMELVERLDNFQTGQ